MSGCVNLLCVHVVLRSYYILLTKPHGTFSPCLLWLSSHIRLSTAIATSLCWGIVMCKQCSHKCHLHSRQDLPSLQLYNSTMAPHSTASQGSPAPRLIARTAALEATYFLPSSHHNLLNLSFLAKVCNNINLTPQPFLPLSHLEVELNTTRLIPHCSTSPPPWQLCSLCGCVGLPSGDL